MCIEKPVFYKTCVQETKSAAVATTAMSLCLSICTMCNGCFSTIPESPDYGKPLTGTGTTQVSILGGWQIFFNSQEIMVVLFILLWLSWEMVRSSKEKRRIKLKRAKYDSGWWKE